MSFLLGSALVFAATQQEVDDLRSKISSSVSLAETEAYRGQIMAIDDASQRASLLRALDNKEARLRRPPVSFSTAGMPVWAIPLMIFAIIAGVGGGLMLRRKRSGTQRDVDEASRELEKVRKFEDRLGSLLEKKTKAYSRAFDIISKTVLEDDYGKQVAGDADRRFQQLAAVDRRIRPKDENEFWLFSPKVDDVRKRRWLADFRQEVSGVLGTGDEAEFRRLEDDVIRISEYLRKEGAKADGDNVKHALSASLSRESFSKEADSLLGFMDGLIVINADQKRNLGEFTALEHHELSLIKRFYTNLELEENNFKELAAKLEEADSSYQMPQRRKGAEEERTEVKKVIIEDEELASFVKALVTRFRQVDPLFDQYNDLLERENSLLMEQRQVIRLFKKAQQNGQASAMSSLRLEARALNDNLSRCMMNEDKAYFMLAGKSYVDKHASHGAAHKGLLVEIAELINQIPERERMIEEEKRRLNKAASGAGQKIAFEQHAELGVLMISSNHTATSVKVMGEKIDTSKKIYLVRDCRITANPVNKTKRGFIYVDIPSNEDDHEIGVHDAVLPANYSWDGELLRRGKHIRFGELEMEFTTETVPRSFVKNMDWSRVFVLREVAR